MDEYTPDAMVNRDDLAPMLDMKKPRRQRSGSPDRVVCWFSNGGNPRLLQQIIPADDDEDGTDLGDKAFVASPKRPPFSLPTMSNNFRRFNARIGVVFLFQTRVERLLSWETPTHTISFLFVYSFICLDPHLVLILPLVILLLFIMVPAFITRHPPPPSTSTSSIVPYYSYEGPALAPAKTIKPASETSKDFFRNMRDLQNVMADFSDAHDAIIGIVAPLTNFSNEKLSSTIFLGGTVATAVMFIMAHLLPLKLIMLAVGNAAVLSINPKVQSFVKALMEDVGGGLSDLDSTAGDEDEGGVGAAIPKDPSVAMSALEQLAEISLDTDPEEREVEIFELQHRASGVSESGWENFLFSPQPYDPLSPSRIAGDRPRGCRFFDDVQPPSGWRWKSKKWHLDLDCREWVVERMITGVGFELQGVTPDNSTIIDQVGGWVWDLPSEQSTAREEEDEEMTPMAYGDLDVSTPSSSQKGPSPHKGKHRAKLSGDWEEAAAASYGVGEWRRRRWVRIVQRMNLPPAGTVTVTYSTLGHN
ncbi:peroxin-24 Pex24-Penicillium chrysogenum [Penicillium brasilianum]|uniref:Peroxin-24 Pex24-Penicillium chrysogenum n=1 Tax=Penicillium brasilianum TaxID=104259 RepID=A0A1S9S1R5_PENBI|nr:peroxin-24 Pex24-Penicillium chrysogenum [Penicillium brasilianum]